LAGNLPPTLEELFEQVAQIITRYSTTDLRSLTAFSLPHRGYYLS
jgi:hypothetical protein